VFAGGPFRSGLEIAGRSKTAHQGLNVAAAGARPGGPETGKPWMNGRM
jgi:hypothetical protein